MLDSSLRDLVSLRTSILNGCAYCVDMHTLDARARGETEQRLYAVATWHEAPFFTERERAALQLTDSITLLADTHVPREVFEEAREQFGFGLGWNGSAPPDSHLSSVVPGRHHCRWLDHQHDGAPPRMRPVHDAPRDRHALTGVEHKRPAPL
jgi:AhpD family alkylhydroperoxidase